MNLTTLIYLNKHLPLVPTFPFQGWLCGEESNEFPIKLLYNAVCYYIKCCTVTLYSKCQFNQHKMCIRLSQIGFTLLSSPLTNKNTHFFSFFSQRVCMHNHTVLPTRFKFKKRCNSATYTPIK